VTISKGNATKGRQNKYKIAYSKLESQLKISKKFKGKTILFQEIMTGTTA
jgi:hypothetical protein